MESESQSVYLETEVLSATPQKLRLMLIEGAIRFASQATAHWRENRDQPAEHAVGRCRAILAELLGTVGSDTSDVACQVRELYAFLLRRLIDVSRTRDENKLTDIINVLQVERETWKQVCQQMPHAPAGHRFGNCPEVTARSVAGIPPTPASNGSPSDSSPGRSDFCLDA